MADHFTFIVSGGRTGTMFFGDLLSQVIEDCYSEHEPDVIYGLDRVSLSLVHQFGIWQTLLGRAIGLTGVRVLGTRYLTGKSDLATTTHQLRGQRRAYHHGVKQGLLVESYWAWWMVCQHLSEIFPGSNTIGIIRDPRHWIESWRSHFANQPNGPWAHRLPPGPITAKTVGDRRWAGEWNRMGAVAQLAWKWNFINSTIDMAVQAGRARMFKFENIFDPKSDTFEQMCLSAATFDDRIYGVRKGTHLLANRRNTSNAALHDWKEWSVDEKHIFNEICGDMLDKYHYPRV